MRRKFILCSVAIYDKNDGPTRKVYKSVIDLQTQKSVKHYKINHFNPKKPKTMKKSFYCDLDISFVTLLRLLGLLIWP